MTAGEPEPLPTFEPAVAREQGALSLELRAATAGARVLGDRGRRLEA